MAVSFLDIILRGKDSGASKSIKTLAQGVEGLNKVMGMFGLAGIGPQQLIDFGQAAVASAREAAAAEAELATVLESSGQATAGYKEQLEALATELENTSNFSDEAIMHAESLLLTFDKIGQETMPRATRAMADLATLMKGDVQGASMQLGKALQGNLTALERSGVSFTESEKAKAEALFATGHAAEAQSIILTALERQVQGQAQAARDAAGGTQDYAVAVDRLQEAMGGLLLTIGDAGATDQAVSWIDRLAAGASAWGSVIENARLLSEANAKLAEESGKVEIAQRGAMGQVAGSQEAYANAEGALSSLIGWFVSGSTEQDGFARAVQEAAGATNEAATVIAATPAKINPAQTAVAAYAAAIRDLTAAQQENLNAPQTNREEDAYLQMAMGRVGMQDAVLQNENEQNQRAADKKRKQEEEAAADSKRIMSEANQAIADSVSELGNQISSAVSGAISGVSQDVIGPLLGLDNAEANAGEAVRRMAAVAAGGIQNEWAPALAAQLTGVKDATAQAFVTAFQSGDDSKLKATAQQLALNPIVELFDAQLIANQVEQKLRAGQLQQALNDKVNALLGEKGLPAIQSVTQQVGAAVTTTGDAVNTVGTNVAGVATTAETAMGQVSASLTGTLTAIDTVTLRIKELVKAIERVTVVAGEAGAAIGGLNPPAPGANGVPNGAQMKMGGPSPQ